MDALRTPAIRHNLLPRTRQRQDQFETHTRLRPHKDMGENTDTRQQDSRHQAQRHRHRNTRLLAGRRPRARHIRLRTATRLHRQGQRHTAGRRNLRSQQHSTEQRPPEPSTVGDKTINICLAAKPVGLVSLKSGDTPSTVIWGGSTLRITEVSPPDPPSGLTTVQHNTGQTTPAKGTTSRLLAQLGQASAIRPSSQASTSTSKNA
jgi:hypothetical protein